MKNLFSAIMLFAILFATNLVAQPNSNAEPQLENTLLWEISGNDLQKPSYIFGTYHMMCKDDFTLGQNVSTALSKTEKLYLELNFTDPNEMQNFQKMMVADQPISQQLPPEKLEKLKIGLKDYGYDLESIDQLSVIAVYSILMQKFFDCQPEELQMLDLQIMQMAMSEGKTVGGLETANEQMEVFAKYVTANELYNMAIDFEKNKKLTKELLNAYATQNLNDMYKYFGEVGEMTKEQSEMFLDYRNENWVKIMPEIMKSQPTFFAVGAGHLPGKKGVIQLLREKGYTLKPIMK